jgi:beta-lactam-binding protein with PASTA domain
LARFATITFTIYDGIAASNMTRFLVEAALVMAAIDLGASLAVAADNRAVAIELRTVPRIKGSHPVEAVQRARLAELALAPGVFYIAPQNWRDDILPRTIYIQTPQPGALARVGGTVAGWTFSKASTKQSIVTMPDLRDSVWRDALQRLAELKLPLLDKENPADPESDTTVRDQYPEPGQPVYEGTSVYLIRGQAHVH